MINEGILDRLSIWSRRLTTFLPTPIFSNALNASKRFRFGLLYFSHSRRSAADNWAFKALLVFEAMLIYGSSLSRNRWTMATSATYAAIFSRDRNFSGVGKNSLLKNYIRLVDQINKKESRVKNPFLALHLRHPTPSRQVDITVIHLLAT